MIHTLAWESNAINAVETDIAPVQDSIFLIQNSHFVPSVDVQIQAACFMSLNAQRARIVTPTLRQVTTPFIRPVNLALTPTSRPLVADYRGNPLHLKGLEEVQVLTLQGGAGAEHSGVVMLVSNGPLTPAPQGDVYTMRGTATTAAVANVWTQLAVTWQDILPAGRYAVIGMETVSATARAARLILNDSAWRPGCLGMSADGNGTHPMFRMGGLGQWGQFYAYAMPNVETLCDTTDATHEIYLDIVRVG